MSILSCNNVNFFYDRKVVLKDVSFSINEGDFLAVIGENGAGKTTLLKILLGFIKARSGQVIVGSGDRVLPIGYLPQQNQIQRNFPATVEEIVLTGTLNSLKGLFFGKKQKDLARMNMKALNIEGLAGRSFRQLSGGQQQRVLMARALCSTDKLLFLDEPVAGLDPVATEDLYSHIRRINRERGVTVVMVSHDLEAAFRFSNKILALKYDNGGGSVAYFGDTASYRQNSGGGYDRFN